MLLTVLVLRALALPSYVRCTMCHCISLLHPQYSTLTQYRWCDQTGAAVSAALRMAKLTAGEHQMIEESGAHSAQPSAATEKLRKRMLSAAYFFRFGVWLSSVRIAMKIGLVVRRRCGPRRRRGGGHRWQAAAQCAASPTLRADIAAGRRTAPTAYGSTLPTSRTPRVTGPRRPCCRSALARPTHPSTSLMYLTITCESCDTYILVAYVGV